MRVSLIWLVGCAGPALAPTATGTTPACECADLEARIAALEAQVTMQPPSGTLRTWEGTGAPDGDTCLVGDLDPGEQVIAAEGLRFNKWELLPALHTMTIRTDVDGLVVMQVGSFGEGCDAFDRVRLWIATP